MKRSPCRGRLGRNRSPCRPCRPCPCRPCPCRPCRRWRSAQKRPRKSFVGFDRSSRTATHKSVRLQRARTRRGAATRSLASAAYSRLHSTSVQASGRASTRKWSETASASQTRHSKQLSVCPSARASASMTAPRLRHLSACESARASTHPRTRWKSASSSATALAEESAPMMRLRQWARLIPERSVAAFARVSARESAASTASSSAALLALRSGPGSAGPSALRSAPAKVQRSRPRPCLRSRRPWIGAGADPTTHPRSRRRSGSRR